MCSKMATSLFSAYYYGDHFCYHSNGKSQINIILLQLGYCPLSYDVASESEITPCNKIDKPLVVYRFTGNVMTSITTLRT